MKKMILAFALMLNLSACGTTLSQVPIVIDPSLLERPENLIPLKGTLQTSSKSLATQSTTSKSAAVTK